MSCFNLKLVITTIGKGQEETPSDATHPIGTLYNLTLTKAKNLAAKQGSSTTNNASIRHQKPSKPTKQSIAPN